MGEIEPGGCSLLELSSPCTRSHLRHHPASILFSHHELPLFCNSFPLITQEQLSKRSGPFLSVLMNSEQLTHNVAVLTRVFEQWTMNVCSLMCVDRNSPEGTYQV